MFILQETLANTHTIPGIGKFLNTYMYSKYKHLTTKVIPKTGIPISS